MKKITNMFKLTALAGVLPFIYGCGGGGGGTASLSDFLYGAGSDVPVEAAAQDAVQLAAAVNPETFVNPEPATMLLLGGSLAVTAYFKSRKKL